MKGGAKYKNGVLWLVMGHTRSSAMSPFDRANTTSYSTLIETIHLYRIRDTATYLSKFVDFNLPHLHLTPPYSGESVEFRGDLWQFNAANANFILLYVKTIFLSQTVSEIW